MSWKIRLYRTFGLFIKAQVISILSISASLAVSTHFFVNENIIPGEVNSSATNFDYDRDGNVEIIVGSHSGSAGLLYVLNEAGNVEMEYHDDIAYWPWQVNAAPSVADIDNDLDYEIVFIAGMSGGNSRLYAINPDGSNKSGFPIDLGRYSETHNPQTVAPVIYDLEGDGFQEILCSLSG